MTPAPKIRVLAVDRFERDVKNRLPFRFGIITVTESIQAVIRVTIELADGRRSTGVAAECLGAKWFDKDPAFTDMQNLDQLRQALDIATRLYTAAGTQTAFDLFAETYSEQIARGAALGLVPLVASYGPALLDRAVLDALGRAHGLSFAEMTRRNIAGMRQTDLTPDLADYDLGVFLTNLSPADSIDVRHTVGLLDPITAADQKPSDRVNDGLPETLEEVVQLYGGRYYKLKVAGDLPQDLDRLSRIASVLDGEAGDYRATLDGNEQYDDIEGISELWRRIAETAKLARLANAIVFIEQPIKRAVALSKPVERLAALKPLIIDESDGEIGSFPAALALGYTGVSSKTCKGVYKSILNATRVARINESGRRRAFMSAEDLTTLAGTSVQQDLALVSLIGLTHVERNGHHFVDGMSFAPDSEQASFAVAHRDLYDRSGGPARLTIDRGRLKLGSLRCPGFASGGTMDFDAMRAMPEAPRGRLIPAQQKGPS